MCHRRAFWIASVLLLLSWGCKKPTNQQPVVVHLFRDLYSPYAHELDHRILEFQATNPRLPSGAPIVIQTLSEYDYKTALKGDFDKNIRVEAVILNSPADAAENPGLVADLAHAVDICASVKACPANVPAFVSSNAIAERADAAQIFLTALAKPPK
jgi:hypothetical protein